MNFFEAFSKGLTKRNLNNTVSLQTMNRFTVGWVLFVFCVGLGLGKPAKDKSTVKKIVKRWDLLVNQDRKFIFIKKTILDLMLVMLIIFRANMDQSDKASCL